MRIALSVALCIGFVRLMYIAYPSPEVEVCAIYLSVLYVKSRITFKGGLTRKAAELEAARLNASEMSAIKYIVLCGRAY